MYLHVVFLRIQAKFPRVPQFSRLQLPVTSAWRGCWGGRGTMLGRRAGRLWSRYTLTRTFLWLVTYYCCTNMNAITKKKTFCWNLPYLILGLSLVNFEDFNFYSWNFLKQTLWGFNGYEECSSNDDFTHFVYLLSVFRNFCHLGTYNDHALILTNLWLVFDYTDYPSCLSTIRHVRLMQ